MRVCVVGLGKLGLPVASAFRSQGFDVVGVDTNEKLIQSLQDFTFVTDEPNVNLDGIDLKTQPPLNCAAYFICVPTPSRADGSFDDSFVRSAVHSATYGNNLVVIVSTLMPGQSRKIAEELPTNTLCYSPTFIALGSVVRDFLNPDIRIIGSYNKIDSHFLESIYGLLPYAPIKKMSLESAEIAKLATNCFVTTKIAYANQLQMLCEATPNADVDDVTEAMGMDSRIGPKSLKAGMPFGGPCFPRDVKALSTLTSFSHIEELNNIHASKLAYLFPWNTTGSKFFLGRSYKTGTENIEQSPTSLLFQKLYTIEGSFSSDDISHIETATVVVICTQDPRWLQGDYRDKIVFDPWGYFKEHGVACKQLITPGRRR